MYWTLYTVVILVEGWRNKLLVPEQDSRLIVVRCTAAFVLALGMLALRVAGSIRKIALPVVGSIQIVVWRAVDNMIWLAVLDNRSSIAFVTAKEGSMMFDQKR
mmetsp:Transcript_19779/g.47039  ORF Transcript_19779/g.47039 Transcript_19779/m.47039 type:complete len:103 (+) Transcript_19779:499-807(+)